MGKLNQVIAVISGKKTKATQALTEAYHRIQKPELFSGLDRTYSPKDEEGDRLPPERKPVQIKVADLVKSVREVLTDLYDVVATQDFANAEAKADVVVNGRIILKKIPVTHLLFLEKQLTDLSTFVGKLPTLDPTEDWSLNEASALYASRPSETVRSKKVPKAFVKYEATKEHPAQVETFHEDVLVGYWKAIKFSGAIPSSLKEQWQEKVRKLQEAVVHAREEANSREATPVNVGEHIFDFVFGGK